MLNILDKELFERQMNDHGIEHCRGYYIDSFNWEGRPREDFFRFLRTIKNGHVKSINRAGSLYLSLRDGEITIPKRCYIASIVARSDVREYTTKEISTTSDEHNIITIGDSIGIKRKQYIVAVDATNKFITGPIEQPSQRMID